MSHVKIVRKIHKIVGGFKTKIKDSREAKFEKAVCIVGL